MGQNYIFENKQRGQEATNIIKLISIVPCFVCICVLCVVCCVWGEISYHSQVRRIVGYDGMVCVHDMGIDHGCGCCR